MIGILSTCHKLKIKRRSRCLPYCPPLLSCFFISFSSSVSYTDVISYICYQPNSQIQTCANHQQQTLEWHFGGRSLAPNIWRSLVFEQSPVKSHLLAWCVFPYARRTPSLQEDRACAWHSADSVLPLKSHFKGQHCDQNALCNNSILTTEAGHLWQKPSSSFRHFFNVIHGGGGRQEYILSSLCALFLCLFSNWPKCFIQGSPMTSEMECAILNAHKGKNVTGIGEEVQGAEQPIFYKFKGCGHFVWGHHCSSAEPFLSAAAQTANYLKAPRMSCSPPANP